MKCGAAIAVLLGLSLAPLGAAAAGADDSHACAATDQDCVATLRGSYDRMLRDLAGNYWDGDRRQPHIRPTDGSGGATTGLVVAGDRRFSFWQMCQYANVLYWDWKSTHSDQARRKLRQQWAHVRATFTDAELSTQWLGRTINASDDAGWEANYLVQVAEVTGDRRALVDAAALFRSVTAYFADPTPDAAVAYGQGLAGSKYGLLYVTPAQGDAYRLFGVISSAYETGLALAALAVHDATGDAALLAYAKGTWQWQHRLLMTAPDNEHGLTRPAAGIVYCELDIRPLGADGQANPHYLRPQHDNFGAPQQGLSAEYLGGTMAMAVLSQRLFTATHDPVYATAAAAIVAAMVAPNGYLTEQGLLLNDRDPWTDGYWAPAFAAEVLAKTATPPAATLARALRDTARNIIAQRTPSGHYGGDWSGPPGGVAHRNALGFSTYEAQAASANGGAGGGQASPDQIMTSSSSAALVQAAVAIGE